MSRLPFDPGKMRAAEQAAQVDAAPQDHTQSASPTPNPTKPEPPRPLTVSRLAETISSALRQGVPRAVRVIGELSNVKNRSHWYFALKDDNAVIDAVMFAGKARSLSFQPASGLKVVATGSVEFYPKQGRTQLYIDTMEPAGEGDLDRQYRELCAALKKEGYFDVDRKRPLPRFPRRVAVITSRTGAAFQDVLDTMRRRCAAVGVALFDVRVQGENAAPAIVRAINHVSAHSHELNIDAVILTRGGGSIEDLWAFNERPVAQAIARCTVPIVAAIGHETDTTIAELVADERAATPTQAAMRLTPDASALEEQLDLLTGRLTRAANRTIRTETDRVARAASRPALTDPAKLITAKSEQLGNLTFKANARLRATLASKRDHLHRLGARLASKRPEAQYAHRRAQLTALGQQLTRAAVQKVHKTDLLTLADALKGAFQTRLKSENVRLCALQRELAMVGPARVLARGYTVTTKADGSIVKSPQDVRTGEHINTKLSTGALQSIITDDTGTTPVPTAPAAVPAQAPQEPLAPPPRVSPRPAPKRGRKGKSKGKGDDPNQHTLF